MAILARYNQLLSSGVRHWQELNDTAQSWRQTPEQLCLLHRRELKAWGISYNLFATILQIPENIFLV